MMLESISLIWIIDLFYQSGRCTIPNMLRVARPAVLFMFIMLLLGCGGDKKVPKRVEDQTPNIRSFNLPYQKVWKATLDTVEFEFLMGIEMQEVKRGFFSTEMIRDYQPFQKRRFRVSGTLIFDGQVTIVKLYKHEEILFDNEWKAIPSDSKLEAQMLQKIAKKLGQTKTKTKK